jgi:signal transduction histidine kinase
VTATWPYLIAKRDLLPEIEALSIGAGDAAKTEIAELLRLGSEKLDELESTIAMRRAGKSDEALAIVNNDSGYRIMDRFRQTVEALRSSGQETLRDRIADTERLRLLSQIGLAGAIAFVLVIATGTIRDGRRRIAELSLANQNLEAEIAERKQAANQVRQLQKMEAVGQLTSGIAHDFNNMLAVVIGSLDIARRRLTDAENPAVLQCINNAVAGAERAAVLTASLLAFSRQQPLDPKVLDLNKLVAGMS